MLQGGRNEVKCRWCTLGARRRRLRRGSRSARRNRTAGAWPARRGNRATRCAAARPPPLHPTITTRQISLCKSSSAPCSFSIFIYKNYPKFYFFSVKCHTTKVCHENSKDRNGGLPRVEKEMRLLYLIFSLICFND